MTLTQEQLTAAIESYARTTAAKARIETYVANQSVQDAMTASAKEAQRYSGSCPAGLILFFLGFDLGVHVGRSLAEATR